MNQKNNSEKKYQEWEKRWRSEKGPQLTLIGRRMLRSKQKILKEAVGTLGIRKAIDVGCGLGFTLSAFKELKIDAVGIDVSETAVKVCENKGLKVFKKKLEEVKEKYDLVFSDGLLEHFLNFEPYVRYLTRISNKYVLIIQTNHQSFLGKTSVYLSELFRGSTNVFEYNYRIKDFISVFEKYGFKLVSEKSFFGGVFKLLLFKKK